MNSITIAIHLDTASPLLRRFAGIRERGEELHEFMGTKALEMSRDYLTEYSANHPNALGGARTNYWARAGQEAYSTATAESASVKFPTPGIGRALHDITILPGTRTPGTTKLTIPATAEAYNRRAGSFTGLVVFWGKGRPMGLKMGEQKTRTRTTSRGGKGSPYWAPQPGGLVYYWFADSVFQSQNRELLPSDEQFRTSAIKGARSFILKLRKELES